LQGRNLAETRQAPACFRQTARKTSSKAPPPLALMPKERVSLRILSTKAPGPGRVAKPGNREPYRVSPWGARAFGAPGAAIPNQKAAAERAIGRPSTGCGRGNPCPIPGPAFFPKKNPPSGVHPWSRPAAGGPTKTKTPPPPVAVETILRRAGPYQHNKNRESSRATNLRCAVGEMSTSGRPTFCRA